MTIVYDPLTYRTLVSRPGELPYKFWSVNKLVIDAAAAGLCVLQSSDAAPSDTTKLWLDLTLPESAVGAVKAYSGGAWVALTPQLFYAHIAGGATGYVTDAEMAAYVSGLIGSTLQGYDADLATWSGLTPSANAQSIVTAADYAAMRALLDLEAGTDFLTPAAIAAAYQPLDGDLTSIAALSTTAYGRDFLALADAAAARAALALGTLATQSGTFSGTSSGTNTGDQTISLTGDVTGSGTGSFAATLATVNSNTGSWGLAGSVAQFVVNAKGLITSAANVAISIASTAISDATAAGRSMLTAANAAAQTALLSAFVGDSGSGGTKGLVPAPAAGDTTKFLKGDGTFAAIPGGGDLLAANNLSDLSNVVTARTNLGLMPSSPGGRLTFASVTPVMTSSVTGAASTYYAPHEHQYCPIYDGTNFVMSNLGGELSQTATDTTKSPAAVAADANYDLFVWNDGGTFRCTRGPAWSSGTSRGTGAGTTELTRVQGIPVNANAITNGPAANRGTYVGTVRSNAASTFTYVPAGSGAGGSAAHITVWNMYNRVAVFANVTDATAGYTYTTSTWRSANNSSANRINFVCGLVQDVLHVSYTFRIDTVATAGSYGAFGVGYDSTTGSTTQYMVIAAPSASAFQIAIPIVANVVPTLGFHFLQGVEVGDGSHANTFNAAGNNNLSMLWRA